MSKRRVKEAPPLGTKWHEFVWRHGGRCVIITGNFDNWAAYAEHSMHPSQDTGIHKLCIALDPSKEWQFKFVVDGVWRCSLDYPTFKDPSGNTNNILYAE
jgi:5'-AMP-activated protein kinase regulatory beta subunit